MNGMIGINGSHSDLLKMKGSGLDHVQVRNLIVDMGMVLMVECLSEEEVLIARLILVDDVK